MLDEPPVEHVQPVQLLLELRLEGRVTKHEEPPGELPRLIPWHGNEIRRDLHAERGLQPDWDSRKDGPGFLDGEDSLQLGLGPRGNNGVQVIPQHVLLAEAGDFLGGLVPEEEHPLLVAERHHLLQLISVNREAHLFPVSAVSRQAGPAAFPYSCTVIMTFMARSRFASMYSYAFL